MRDSRSLSLVVDEAGTVLGVSEDTSDKVFGFAPREALGCSLWDLVDVFSEWRARGACVRARS